MDSKTFLAKMQEEVLDTEMEISMDTLLGDIEEWDSLSVVSFIAMAKATCNKAVDRKAIASAQSVNDLYTLLQ